MTKEKERYSLQQLLDSQKSETERNILGQFSTPYPLAAEMVKYVLSLNQAENVCFLEPSIGTGVFYSALCDILYPHKASGFEIDEHYFKPTTELWADSNLKLIHGNFFDFKPVPEYNVIIANPPYSRHHHIDNVTKKTLQSLIKKEYGIAISGLAGLYCYFLILSTRWLREGGLSCWLIPSEFLDVKYGSAVKEFLCSKVELVSIHKFNPADLQFSDALVSSSIVTFRNRHSQNGSVKFTTGPDILNPTTINEVALDELNPLNKWNAFFDSDIDIKQEQGKNLGNYFKVSRGISTGNNSFFIIPKETAEQKNLPLEFLTPVLPAPRNLHVERIQRDFKGLEETNQYYLLSCPLSKEIIRSRYPELYDYIEEGETKSLNAGYNCKRRNPWYLCEYRKPAPLYMTYMGRGDNKERIFRFILNESDSIVTNSYLMLYPKDNYRHCFEDIKTIEAVWKVLNGIPKNRIARCGRTYGGGLFKIEPKELESLIIPELEDILVPQQRSLFDFSD